MLAEESLELIKYPNPQIRETQWIRINKEISIIRKVQNNQDNEKNLKAAREKREERGTQIREKADSAVMGSPEGGKYGK